MATRTSQPIPLQGELSHEIAERLIADFDFERRPTPEGERLVRGRCPSCGEREAFTPPGFRVVICNRKNKCDAKINVKTLYPELFQQFEKRHPATAEQPTATADAYLRSRGIDPAKIQGWYAQDRTADPGSREADSPSPLAGRGTGDGVQYPTVRFTLSNGVAYHRLIDYAGRNKNKIVAAFRGAHWARPGFDPAQHEGDLWLAEGVLNAISLHIGLENRAGAKAPLSSGRGGLGGEAAANLSSGHVPAALFEALASSPPRKRGGAGGGVRIIIAQDHDRAGRKSADKLAAACKERGLLFAFAFAPAGQDWNDLLLTGDFDPDLVEDTLGEALWRGSLHAADSAPAFFAVWRERMPPGLFEWRGSYYMGRDQKERGEGEEGPSLRRISDFTLEPEVVVARNPAPGRVEHELRALLHNHRRAVKISLTGKELSTLKEFKSAVRTRAWGHWTGNALDLDRLAEHLDDAHPPIVHEIPIVGWDRESDGYLFPDVAYDKRGRAVAPDARGYFTIERRTFHLNLSENEKPIPRLGPERLPEALRLLLQAFGPPGLAVLGFATASLFANQFADRSSTRFFPFLSLYGPAETGKTSMLLLLNRFLGRDVQEGLSLTAVDTAKGQSRQIAAVSNLPVAILEMDRAKAQRFDLNRLLPLFNRGVLQLRAQKSNDLATQEVKFLGSLLFAQNDEQFQGEPQKSRVVSIGFLARLEQGGERLAANKALLALPYGALAAFRHEILSRREKAQPRLFELYESYEGWLAKAGVAATRIAQTHAVVLAGAVLALQIVLPAEEARAIAEDVAHYGLELAQRKIASLFEETDYLALFADSVRELIRENKVEDHSQEEAEVWLHMAQVKRALEEAHAHFDFTRIFQEIDASGKVRFRGKSLYSPHAGHSLRLHGFDRSLFYPEAK